MRVGCLAGRINVTTGLGRLHFSHSTFPEQVVATAAAAATTTTMAGEVAYWPLTVTAGRWLIPLCSGG